MSALFSDEQLMIRDMARKFAQEELLPNSEEWDEKSHFPVDVIRKAAGLGFASIYVKEDVGGAGLTRTDAALIFEQLAYGDVSTAAFISIHNMASWMIDTFGSEAQRKAWLPRLTTMELIASYCLTEPGAGSDAASLKTRAVRDGDDYVITGTKQFISGAGTSDLYVLMARTSDDGAKGVSTFIIEKDTPGLSFGANERKMGWKSQPTRQVILDGVRVPAANRVGEEGHGFKIAMGVLDAGRIGIASQALGIARAAYEATLEYVRDRKAFGQPIGAFQMTQAKIADMKCKLDAATLLTLRAAWKKGQTEQNGGRFSNEAAIAKLTASEAAMWITHQAVQIHGGMGYSKEMPLERYFRDAKITEIYEGTSEIQRLVIARNETGLR